MYKFTTDVCHLRQADQAFTCELVLGRYDSYDLWVIKLTRRFLSLHMLHVSHKKGHITCNLTHTDTKYITNNSGKLHNDCFFANISKISPCFVAEIVGWVIVRRHVTFLLEHCCYNPPLPASSFPSPVLKKGKYSHVNIVQRTLWCHYKSHWLIFEIFLFSRIVGQ